MVLNPIIAVKYLEGKMTKFREAESKEEYQLAVELFKEYASQIGVDLAFQNFNSEIEKIDSHYSKPKGAVFIVYNEKELPIGCFGIRSFESDICELKRMYLKKEARGLGIGKLLLEKAIKVAKELGYKRMRLDTLPTMHSAIGLCKKLGFYEIVPYRFNPIHGTKYFEINLIY